MASSNLQTIIKDGVSAAPPHQIPGMNMPNAEPAQGSVIDQQLQDTPLGFNIITRPMGSHSTRDGGVSISENRVVREPNWDLNKMVEKPLILASADWTTSLTSGTVLGAWDLPGGIFSASDFTSLAFDNFYLWNGDIKFHVQSNGTPFHQGTVILFYMPLVSILSTEFIAACNNFCTITSLQHVVIQANSATSACLTAPFINHNDYLNLTKESGSPWNNTGAVGLIVFNQLNVASGTSTLVDVSVFAQFVDNSFKVPIPRVPAPSLFKGEGVIENFLGDKLGNIIQRMLPQNVIADTINSVTDFMGLDKPTSIERGPPMKMISTQYMNSSVEIDYLDKHSLYPGKLQETDSTVFSVNNDETDFNYLKSRYTYVGSFNQSVTQGTSTVLASIPLQPNPVPIYTAAPTALAYNKVPLLQYISLPFKFWKGGLTYKVQVVASSFHVTKILACIQYGSYEVPPSTFTLNIASSQYGYAFEVNQGATEFEFTVPYVHPRNQLNLNSANNMDDGNCMGMLYFVVVNQLAAPNNVPTSITYNVYIAGAPDYAVSTIANTGDSLIAAFPPVAPSFSGESTLTSPFTDTEHSKKGAVISPSLKLERRVDAQEQSILSLLDPLKKYQQVYSSQIEWDEGDITPKLVIIPLLTFLAPPPTPTTLAPYTSPTRFSMLNYISSLYNGYRGPMRLKIALDSVDIATAFRAYFLPPTNALPDFGYFLSTATQADDDTTPGYTYPVRPREHLSLVNANQKTAEIEVPFATTLKFTKVPRATVGYDYHEEHDFGNLALIFYPPKESYLSAREALYKYDIYCALGDETRFGVFSGVPSLVSAVFASSTSPFVSAGFDTYSNVPSLINTLIQL